MRGRVIAALAMIAVGAVWIGQGIGLLTGSSFMVGDPLWAVIGTALVVGGGLLAISARRHRPGA